MSSSRPQRTRRAPERFEFSPSHKVTDDYASSEHSSDLEDDVDVSVSEKSDDSEFTIENVQEAEASDDDDVPSADLEVSDNDEPDDGDSDLSDVLNSADYEGDDSEEDEVDKEEDDDEPVRPRKRATPAKKTVTKRAKKD